MDHSVEERTPMTEIEMNAANAAIEDAIKAMQMKQLQLRAIRLLYNTAVLEAYAVPDLVCKVMPEMYVRK